jgi:hypothetical protein
MPDVTRTATTGVISPTWPPNGYDTARNTMSSSSLSLDVDETFTVIRSASSRITAGSGKRLN